MDESRIKNMVFTAMFTVLIAVCSWISIPTAIPVTMQTFAVFLAYDYLGARKGLVSVIVYLLLGAIGFPVFANFTSGMGMLVGMTGGYMIGWIGSGLVMWGWEKLAYRKIWMRAASMLMGLLVCYGAGTLWFLVFYAGDAGTGGIWAILLSCVIPFILPDLVKLGLALWFSQRLKRVRI